MRFSQFDAAVNKVIATESDHSTRGIPIIISDPGFNRQVFIRRIVKHFLSAPYDPTKGDPRTVLVCMRSEKELRQLKAVVNNGMQPRGGNLLGERTRQAEIGPLTFASFPILNKARLNTDAFDIVVVNVLAKGELNEFRELFGRLDDMFRVVVLPASMHQRNEMQHWPGLEPAYRVQPRPYSHQRLRTR